MATTKSKQIARAVKPINIMFPFSHLPQWPLLNSFWDKNTPRKEDVANQHSYSCLSKIIYTDAYKHHIYPQQTYNIITAKNI